MPSVTAQQGQLADQCTFLCIGVIFSQESRSCKVSFHCTTGVSSHAHMPAPCRCSETCSCLATSQMTILSGESCVYYLSCTLGSYTLTLLPCGYKRRGRKCPRTACISFESLLAWLHMLVYGEGCKSCLHARASIAVLSNTAYKTSCCQILPASARQHESSAAGRLPPAE